MTSEQGPRVAWQASLFDTGSADDAERLSFSTLRRDHLDDRSWIDVVPGWVPDHGALFDRLREIAPWQQRTRTMWDEDVLEPRLVAAWRTGEPLPQEVVELAEPLSARYDVSIDSCLINLYRDGSDAVAWHADTVRKVLRDPLVFTVSLGARRSFLLRPATGGPVARRYAPGEGDLIVMGGACQHDWHHTVPRERSASGARMSITLRHSRRAGPAGVVAVALLFLGLAALVPAPRVRRRSAVRRLRNGNDAGRVVDGPDGVAVLEAGGSKLLMGGRPLPSVLGATRGYQGRPFAELEVDLLHAAEVAARVKTHDRARLDQVLDAAGVPRLG